MNSCHHTKKETTKKKVRKINRVQRAVREKVEIPGTSRTSLSSTSLGRFLAIPDDISRFVQGLVHFTVPDFWALSDPIEI